MQRLNDCWVGAADETWPAPLFYGRFDAPAGTTATLRVCGLGFTVPFCNGRRVGEDYFVPAFSHYAPRPRESWVFPIADEMRCRAYVLTYDLTEHLLDGANDLHLLVGDGWFRQRDRLVEGDFSFGPPRLTFALDLALPDGTLRQLTSGDWLRSGPGFLPRANLYTGETQDLRRLPAMLADALAPAADGVSGGDPAPTPCPVRPLPPLETVLLPQIAPPDRVTRTLAPRLIAAQGDRRVYDAGENVAGWVVMRLNGRPGEEVCLRHAEELSADRQSLDFASAGGEGQVQTVRYLCDGSPRQVHPWFCWQAFRYFELTGPGEPVAVQTVNAAVPVTAEFACSDPTLTWLFDAYIRTQLANLHAGVPSDCPHRERLGYTGDGQLTAPAALLCLDAESLWAKWWQDIRDGQGANGHVQHTAPYNGGGGGPGGWGGAIWLVPQALYRRSGDLAYLRDALPAVIRWLHYMHSRCEQGLVVREEPDGWCLGDWCQPSGTAEVPAPFINTWYYLQGIDAAAEFARLTDQPMPDGAVWQARRRQSLDALTTAYYDPAVGSFCGGADAADAFALTLGLGDDRLAANLVARYETTGALDTGICATPLLLRTLFDLGRGDLALQLMTRAEGPSFTAMRLAGATTLWEQWDGVYSHSHPMFGGCVTLLFEQVLGIRQAPGTAGWEQVVFEPADLPSLTWARGSVLTPRGRITVAWRRESDGRRVLQADGPIDRIADQIRSKA